MIQEIFGVNHHIRSVCDRLAAEGYVAIAPAIFDRTEPNFQCGYSPDEVANARKFVANPDWAAMLRDTQAAIDAVKDAGPVGIIGFCLGGSIAYVAATKLSGLSAAVGYYGGAVVRFADDKPKVPTQLHFGEKDAGIPLTDVDTITAVAPPARIRHVEGDPGAQHGCATATSARATTRPSPPSPPRHRALDVDRQMIIRWSHSGLQALCRRTGTPVERGRFYNAAAQDGIWF